MKFRQVLNILTVLALFECVSMPVLGANEPFNSSVTGAKDKSLEGSFKLLNIEAIMNESKGKNIHPTSTQILKKLLNESSDEAKDEISSPTQILMAKGGGADAGGGGDAERVAVEEYPERVRLVKSIELVIEKVNTCHYADVFKILVRDEIQKLAEGNKFKYIPTLFFIDQVSAAKQSGQKSATEEFGSLGAMTPFQSDAFVYLSAKTLKYSNEQLAKLLLHETLHHILSYSLTTNDDLVEKLALSIFDSSADRMISEKLSSLTTYQDLLGTCKLSDPNEAEKAVHFELDRVSPYALSKYETSNTLEKIKEHTLSSLQIFQLDTMWLLINLELKKCGFKSISIRNQKLVERAGDVMSLVIAKMYNQKRATFIWNYPEGSASATGLVSQVLTVNVD